MDALLGLLIAHGTYALLFAPLVVAGLGIPIPEDLVLLAGGVLSHRGVTSFAITLVVCFAGVLVGDTLLFLGARRLGLAAYDHPRFARLLPARRRARIERLFARRGGAVVFVARHLVGLRAPVFAMAGIHGMRLSRFLLWDGLGLCITAPVVLYLGYVMSDHVDLARAGLAHVEHYVAIAAIFAFVAYAVFVVVRRYRRRRSDAS